MWQFEQTVGYFTGSATCVVGLFERWHVEQLAVTPVCEYFTVAHTGYVWQFEQTVGYAVGLAVCVVGRWLEWHAEQVMVVVWTNVLGLQAGYLWHCSQVEGYFCVLAVWVTGLFAR